MDRKFAQNIECFPSNVLYIFDRNKHRLKHG